MTRGALLGVTLFASIPAHAAQWPSIEPPPRTQVHWIADDMMQNGVPMKIKQFSGKMSPEEVLGYYRQRWDDSAAKPVENAVGDWRVIGRRVGDHYMTVQVRRAEGGDSEGLMTVSALPKALSGELVPTRDTAFAKPPGSDVLSNSVSHDYGRTATTLLFANRSSPQSNAAFYRSRLVTAGWEVHQDEQVMTAHGAAYVLFFQREGESCQIGIARDAGGSTMISVSWMKDDA